MFAPSDEAGREWARGGGANRDSSDSARLLKQQRVEESAGVEGKRSKQEKGHREWRACEFKEQIVVFSNVRPSERYTPCYE